MNRTKNASRRYEAAKPQIDVERDRRRSAKKWLKNNPTASKSDLLKMAILLGIKGRASMNKTELVDAIRAATR